MSCEQDMGFFLVVRCRGSIFLFSNGAIVPVVRYGGMIFLLRCSGVNGDLVDVNENLVLGCVEVVERVLESTSWYNVGDNTQIW